ncbi:MAG: SDR family oxidoreductase [Nitrososphaerales archaeon]|nr:SDR family oxidoreductase [Nitrososphaerales archaeon]
MKAFENKIVVLTGASSGIGYSLLNYFIKEGARVYGSSRNERELTTESKQECNFELLDLADELNVEKYVKTILQKENRIDILINNAGVAHNLALVEEINSEMLNSVVRDNLLPTFNMMKYTIPIMKKNNSGTIINISSRAGRRAVPKLSAYTAAKFAVRGLTESVAKELQDTGIKCISISPAGVNTGMRAMVFGQEDAENQQDTSRINEVISRILSGSLKVSNGSDIVIIKDKEPIIMVPEI